MWVCVFVHPVKILMESVEKSIFFVLLHHGEGYFATVKGTLFLWHSHYVTRYIFHGVHFFLFSSIPFLFFSFHSVHVAMFFFSTKKKVIVKSIKNFIWHKSQNWSRSPLGNASFISYSSIFSVAADAAVAVSAFCFWFMSLLYALNML